MQAFFLGRGEKGVRFHSRQASLRVVVVGGKVGSNHSLFYKLKEYPVLQRNISFTTFLM